MEQILTCFPRLWCLTLQSSTWKILYLLNHAAGNSAHHIQSYPLDWVRHYHYNDCAKYHFNNKLISNWKFWREQNKKICWTVQQVTVHSKFRVILRIWFDIITTMSVQNSIFITNLFGIESFGSWTCPLKRKKHPTKSRHLLSNEVK